MRRWRAGGLVFSGQHRSQPVSFRRPRRRVDLQQVQHQRIERFEGRGLDAIRREREGRVGTVDADTERRIT